MDILKNKSSNITQKDYLNPKYFSDSKLTRESKLLGTGGFGNIYFNKYLGMDVAIKVPKITK